MNFIEQAQLGQNKWWQMLLTLFFTIIGWQAIGVLPLVSVAMMYSYDESAFDKAANNNFIGLGIPTNLYFFLMIFMFAVGLISLLLSIQKVHKRRILSVLTSRTSFDWKRFFYAVLIWTFFSLLLMVIDYYMHPQDFVWNFKGQAFLILVLLSIVFLPLQTTFEELLFRGYLLQTIAMESTKKSFVFRWAFYFALSFVLYFLDFHNLIKFGIFIILGFFFEMVNEKGLLAKIYATSFYRILSISFRSYLIPLTVTSVAFGLLHGFNPEVEKLGKILLFYYIATGFFFGIITLIDEGLELALGLHAANNAVAAIFITTNWTVFQTDALLIDQSEPNLGLMMYVPLFVIYPIVFFILYKKYGWNDIKNKLFGKYKIRL